MPATGIDMNKQQGFTLTELMVTVAIISILAAIAYPSYTGHLRKTRRNMAAACLQQNAQFMERWYTSNLTYVGGTAQPCTEELQPFYTVTMSVDASEPRLFTARATPIGAQTSDDCGTLTLDERGERTASGGTVNACW
jgi:type IV pilus assembly protein PilE